MTLEEMLQMERKRKKKQKYDDEEHRIQCSCVKWFNLKYPKLKGRLFAVPNGGRRDTTNFLLPSFIRHYIFYVTTFL